MIRTCTCKHEGQDALHNTGGRKNQRVFNHVPSKEKGKPDEYRCTVCGAVQTETPKS